MAHQQQQQQQQQEQEEDREADPVPVAVSRLPDPPIRSPRLPAELLSLVLSFLPLGQLVALGLHATFFRQLLASPVLHPYAPLLRATLGQPQQQPYPPELGRLAALGLAPPSVARDLLVGGRAEWCLFEVELPPGLAEAAWEDVCRRRFLPSWCAADQRRRVRSWRELYLRTLSRIVHRQRTSCTTDEPYVRWIQLDRKGSATVNRLRAAGFDPIGVYRELASAQVRPPPPRQPSFSRARFPPPCGLPSALLPSPFPPPD